jgi:hypothetical protein
MKNLIVLLSIFYTTISLAFGQEKYEQYCNQKFNYCVTYPASLLSAQPALEGIEGRDFKAKNGEAKVSFEAKKAEEVIEPSLGFKSIYTGETYSKQVTYEVVKADWFVISGYTEDENIFYTKVILKNKVVYFIRLEYPKSEKKVWDSQCGKIANSLIIK